MWKIWLGVGIGGLVGAIVVLLGIVNQARVSVIFYRAVVSMIVFGGGSSLVAFVYERYLLPYLLHKTVLHNGHDVAGTEKSDVDVVIRDTEELENRDVDENGQGFSPFTTENFNRVSPPNN